MRDTYQTTSADFAIVRKDGIVQTIGRSSIVTPQIKYNNQGINWFDDNQLLKKGVKKND